MKCQIGRYSLVYSFKLFSSLHVSDPGGGSKLSARSSQGPGVWDQESQVFPDSAPGPGDAGTAQDMGRVRVVQCGENTISQSQAFIITIDQLQVKNYKQGQDEAVSGHLISICLNELEDSDPTYRQWLVSVMLREFFVKAEYFAVCR